MGLDPSPTATGICVAVAPDGWSTYHVGRHMSKEEWNNPVHAVALWHENLTAIRKLIDRYGVVELAMESRQFTLHQSSHLIEYIGAMKWALWHDKATPPCLKNIRMVTAGTVRKYLSPEVTKRTPETKGRAKDVVREFLAKRKIVFPDDNEMDAWVIANWLSGQVNGRQLRRR